MTLSPRMRLFGWIALGVLGGGLVTGIAIGSATAASPSPTPSPYAYGQPGPGMPGGPLHRLRDRLEGLLPDLPMGPGGGAGLLGGRVLHGEATVGAPDGTTKVVFIQSGDITDITGSTITVKSSDGYTASYAVDKNTRISLNGTDGTASSLAKGDTVRVTGTKNGSTNHADAVLDGMPPRLHYFDHDHNGPQPQPSGSASAAT